MTENEYKTVEKTVEGRTYPRWIEYRDTLAYELLPDSKEDVHVQTLTRESWEITISYRHRKKLKKGGIKTYKLVSLEFTKQDNVNIEDLEDWRKDRIIHILDPKINNKKLTGELEIDNKKLTREVDFTVDAKQTDEANIYVCLEMT